MRRIIVILLFVMFYFKVNGQDIHFSQFDRNPLFLNPALTGQMDGWMRSNVQYKSQWTVVGASYNTASFSFDTPLLKGRDGAYIGVGLNVFRDKAGDTKFGFTNIGLSTSAILPIGDQSELSLGVRASFVQRTMSTSGLQWDSQFDGTGYNSTLSGEALSSPAFGYFDYNTGINYHFESSNSTLSSNDRILMDIGGAYNHITQPAMQFKASDRLPYRITVYGISEFGIYSTKYFVSPQVMYSIQSRQVELIAGGYFGYRLVEDSRATGFIRRSSVGMGLLYRFKDAFIPTVKYEIADFICQVSYDVNTSGLSPFTAGRGGFEISISYVDHLGNVFGKGSTGRSLF